MKKIIFIFAFLVPTMLWSQNYLSKFQKLKEELDYIASVKQKIKTISISESGDWVILYGDVGYSYSAMPNLAKNYLSKCNSQGILLKDFDFFNDSSWVCISSHNAYAMKYAPSDIHKKLKFLNKNRVKIYNLSYNNGHWAIVYGRGNIEAHNIDENMQNNIKLLKKNNRLIKKIEFCNEGWLILYGKNGFKANNLRQDLISSLNNLQKADNEINTVAFFNSAWIIIYDDYKYLSNF